MTAELRDGSGRLIETRTRRSYDEAEQRAREARRVELERKWERDYQKFRGEAERLDREEQADRAQREKDLNRRTERRLKLDDRVPTWIDLASSGGATRCGRSIETLIDSDGLGSCRRHHGHEGRHMAADTARRIIGIGPWRQRKDGIWAYYTRSGTERFGSETKSPSADIALKAALKKAEMLAPPKPPPAPVKVGKPCPEHIVLDQGENRCRFYGARLDHLMCSRRGGHTGEHVATDGDTVGAEVIAVYTPK